MRVCHEAISKEYKNASRRILGKVDHDVVKGLAKQNTSHTAAPKPTTMGNARVASTITASTETISKASTPASDSSGIHSHSYEANFPPLTPELRDVFETSSVNGEFFTRAYDLAVQAAGAYRAHDRVEHYISAFGAYQRPQ